LVLAVEWCSFLVLILLMPCFFGGASFFAPKQNATCDFQKDPETLIEKCILVEILRRICRKHFCCCRRPLLLLPSLMAKLWKQGVVLAACCCLWVFHRQ